MEKNQPRYTNLVTVFLICLLLTVAGLALIFYAAIEGNSLWIAFSGCMVIIIMIGYGRAMLQRKDEDMEEVRKRTEEMARKAIIQRQIEEAIRRMKEPPIEEDQNIKQRQNDGNSYRL